MKNLSSPIRPLFWVGSSDKDYRDFPPAVQDSFGYELFLAQIGEHPPSAKPLKGLGPGTVELIEDFNGDSCRAIYTVRFRAAVYVLHAFMKKLKSGIKTPQKDIDLIKRRLKTAESDHLLRTESELEK